MPRPCRRLALAASAAAVMLAAACAGQQPRPYVQPPMPGGPAAIVRTAQSFLGAPYRAGGADPRGFDCSGFIQFVFARHGVALPRNVTSQWAAGREIDRRHIQQGDLLFFATAGRGPTHVTLALDRERFIHAPSSRGVVRIESLSSAYWSRRFVGARRIVR